MENKTHKYLPKLLSLQKRMLMWKQVGEACTEQQWNEMEFRLVDLTKIIDNCTNNNQYPIPTHTLKLYNNYYKQYNCIPGEKLAYTNKEENNVNTR